MSTETCVSGGSSISGALYTNSTIGQQASVVQATLQQVAKQQAFNAAPLKVPDLRKFGVGWEINISA
jgi:hypothetical protein